MRFTVKKVAKSQTIVHPKLFYSSMATNLSPRKNCRGQIIRPGFMGVYSFKKFNPPLTKCMYIVSASLKRFLLCFFCKKLLIFCTPRYFSRISTHDKPEPGV